MTRTQPAKRRELILRSAVQQRLLEPDHAVLAGFIDLDGVLAGITNLHRAFPASLNVMHTVAAKANCLVPVLEAFSRNGMGCEVASPGELAQALAAGFAPERIVYDSPSKTRAELAQALELGVTVNADNFQELERMDGILAGRASDSRIGVRINPQVGSGDIAAMSTATLTSKFGIALEDDGNRRRLIQEFQDRPWLTWLHAHVGSQGCPLELMAEGIAKTVALAEEINASLGRRQVVGIDIGGGLPVNFTGDDTAPTFDEYVERLRAYAPALFSGAYQIVTEFGRSLLAKNGFTAAYVEYTKTSGGRRIVITHAGAQVAARTVFMPDSWPIRITAHNPSGHLKEGATAPQDIAGPCCFAGDVVAQARSLPVLEPGDIVTLLDTGAYYFSTPFHYNSLPDPAVYAVHTNPDGEVKFDLVRRAESIQELLDRTGAHQL
ncbi:diaminopimelate decarboxylase [Streptomyces sp. RKCA744]|uniref:diaminopimelate decarboxylase n=1 Tax=Streptomyces sp. RKCA744 TaxID=2959340 RepID=UPI0020A1966B|nr:diaminopimelate decarboxylase [Streptomyces sp. RKCA744]MCO8303728.1 diaminopimelate decarboxylase [Streptomyces sp. RKCA744]